MKRTELRLPDDLYDEIRERAHKSRISLNALIVLILKLQIKTETK